MQERRRYEVEFYFLCVLLLPYFFSQSLCPPLSSFEGISLLKNVPFVPEDQRYLAPLEFVENCNKAFEDCLNEIRSRWDREDKRRDDWERWFSTKCPMNQDAASFVSNRQNRYRCPLLIIFREDFKARAPWLVGLSSESASSGDRFADWPENWQVSAPSVVTSITPARIPPRFSAAPSARMQASVNSFREKIATYVDSVLSGMTVPTLKELLRRRISAKGDSLSLGGDKNALVNRIKESDVNFFSIFSRSLNSDYSYWVKTVLTEHIGDEAELDGMMLSLLVGEQTLSLTRRQIRLFNPGQRLTDTVLDRIRDIYHDVNSGKNNYVAFKSSAFISIDFLRSFRDTCDAAIQDLSVFDPLKAYEYHSVYFPVRLEDGGETCALFVADIYAKSIRFFNPSNPSLSPDDMDAPDAGIVSAIELISSLLSRSDRHDWNQALWPCTSLVELFFNCKKGSYYPRLCPAG